MMSQLNISEVFNAPADKVWELIRNFGNIEALWLKDSPIKIDRVVQEGTGVGMIRHIYWTGLRTPVSERLEYLDDDSRTYGLSIVGEGLPGLISYSARGVVRKLEANCCRLDYVADVQARPEKATRVEQSLRFGISQLIAGLKATVED